MKIGIIGRGSVASALSKRFARSHEVRLGVRSVADPSEAPIGDVALWTDVILLATPWGAEEEVCHAIADHAAGKPVIDATNPVGMRNGRLDLVHDGPGSAAETLQARLPAAHVVKCFNQIGAEFMDDASKLSSTPVMLVASDALDLVRPQGAPWANIRLCPVSRKTKGHLMELYHWPMSHNARKARALARHLGVEVEEIALSMQDKDHKADSFLSINPMGQVPAIKDGDYSVWEANAVLIYLAAQSPNDLLGQSAQEWGHITQWMTWQSVELSPVVVPLHVENYFKRVRGIEADAVKRDAALKKLHALLKVLNDALDGQDHLVGGRLTVADFAVAGDFTHAKNANFPLSDFPNVARWLAGIEALPAWADTTPPTLG